MEEGKHAQVLQKVALAGMLMAVLLAQGVASLRCYSCKDFNDGGCAVDRIKIEECTPPRNVCLEAITIVTIDKQNVSAAIKGCDIGILHSQEMQVGLFNTSHKRMKAHACSEDLCNTLVTEDFLHQPPFILPDSSVPNDRECYSCVSTSRNQCSTKNAAVVKCQGHSPVCYQGIGTIVLGHQNNITLPYFIKECAQPFCSALVSGASEYVNDTRRGSCCHRNLCNGFVPIGVPHAATYVAPLIVAALLAISGL